MSTPAIADTKKLVGYSAPNFPTDPSAQAVFLTEEFRKLAAVLKVTNEVLRAHELRLASGSL